MKKITLFIGACFISAIAVAQTSNTCIAKPIKAEQIETVFSQWSAAMENIRVANNLSAEDFATFTRFEENPLQVLKAGLLSDARKENFDAIAVSNTLKTTENNIRLLYLKFKNAKKMYPSSVSEYARPRVVPSVNPCDSTGCNNMGFENGNFNGWYGYYATKANNCVTATISGITGGALGAVTEACNDPVTASYNALTTDYQLSITSGGNDAIVPSISRVSPWGGTHSVMLGDSTWLGFGAAILSKTFLVTPGNENLTYEYAVLLENPGHCYGNQPIFSVTILDENGDTIPACGEYLVTSGYGIHGFDSTLYEGTWVYYKNWNMTTVPLNHYVGQCVTITFESTDCGQGGHFGYAYVDASCSPLTVTTSSPNICGTDSVELSAPPGAGSYFWSGPANGILSNDSLQNIWVDSAGTYSVVVNPILGHLCSDTISVTLGKLPAASIHPNFTSNIVCAGQPTSFTNTSNPISGTFNWDFYNLGNYNDTNVVNPTWTYALPGTYTVKLEELFGGCGTDTLITVKVDSNLVNPTFTINPTCFGDSSFFTPHAPGATIYDWIFGDPATGIHDSSTLANPGHLFSSAGTFTVTLKVANGGGCSSDTSIAITIYAPPTPHIAGIDTICPGSKDTLWATGGASYIWMPSGSTNAYLPAAPTVTKTFTLEAFNGTCQKDTTFTINVVATPSVTLSGPSSIALGDSGILSANCNVPATFSWAPSSSVTHPTWASTEATPTVTTTYTCTAVTACGTFTATITVTVGPCANSYNEPICIATVDTATNFAEVIWGRTNSPVGTGSYHIYKDSTLGYELTHSQPLNVLSEYLDPLSNPSAGAVSYELSTDDSCGESALSSPHTTVYLVVSTGVNSFILNWTAYVGFTPSEYRIFRGLTMGSLVKIDSVPGGILTFTDSFPPAGSIYLVEAVNPSGACIPTTKIKPHGMNAATLSGSFSNGFNTAILGVENVKNAISNLNIYPNPSNGQITIEWSVNSGQSAVRISIYDELGQVVYDDTETQTVGKNTKQLNLESLAAGIYTLRMQTTSGTTIRKVVLMKK